MTTLDQAIALPNEKVAPWRIAYRNGRRIVLFAFWIASLIAFLGAFGGGFGFYAAWIAWVFSAFTAVLVHELGHAVAAVLCGWGIAVFAAGPVGLQVHNRDFAIIPRSRRTEAEGFVMSLPLSSRVWTRERYAVIVGGGPAASLLQTAVAIALAVHWAPSSGSGLDLFALSSGFALASGATSLSTLTPGSRVNGNADIQNFLRTLRTDELQWSRERALNWLFSLTKNKLRLRDLPHWMIEEAREQVGAIGGDLQRAYDSLIIGIVLDSPPVDRTDTRNRLDEFRRKYGGSAWLDSCDAYFTAVWEGDAAEARRRLWHGDGDEDMRPMILAADAAVSAREGDGRVARVLLAQMRDAVRKRSIFPDLTFRDIERQIEGLLPN